MIVRNPVNRFLKRIGAYTVSDEDLALSEIYESLPRDEREILDRVLGKSQTVEEAGRGMGLSDEETRRLFDRATERVRDLTDKLSREESAL